MLENGSRARSLIQRVFVSVALFSLSYAMPAFAQTALSPDNLNAVGAQSGIAGGSDLTTIIGRIIYVALSFVGIILLGLLIYAGYLWMTSGGDAAKIEQAKSYIKNAVIGLVIIVSSFAITSFILAQLAGVAGFGGGSGTAPFGNGYNSFPSHAGSLGSGIIESHLPQRNATGVPRNTPIVFTFKEPIRLNSVIKGWTETTSSTDRDLNDLAIKIYPAGFRDQALVFNKAAVRYTSDRKTFVIRPTELLGNAITDTDYVVELIGGGTGILLDDGSAAFGGTFGAGYSWPFQVSTIVDNTPPRVESVVPSDGGTFAPNVVVQMNFSEPIDPTAAGGIWDGTGGFSNVEVRSTKTSPASSPEVRPSGEFRVSNGYRTVEFTTNLACGTNSCGNTIYCLPGSSATNVHIKSPTLSSPPSPQALLNAGSGYDGIVDMVGNALDGNENGTSEGPGTDDYSWGFGTEAEPNLSAPRIESTLPPFGDDVLSSNMPMDSKPVASFDSVLQSSTVNSDTVILQTNEPESMADTFWWTLSQDPLTAAGALVVRPAIASKGRLTIDHRLYSMAPTSTPIGGAVPVYQPIIKSGLQNVYQNCFNPAGPAISTQCTGIPSANCCNGVYGSGACPDLVHITP